MRAEELMSCIEDRKLQRVDDAADGVDDAAGNKPEESGCGQGSHQRHHGQDAEPSHGDIDQRGKPFGTGDPEGFDQYPGDGGPPYQRKERITYGIPKRNHADRCIAAGDQYKDHHVVHLPQDPVDIL